MACKAQERQDQEIHFLGTPRSRTTSGDGFWCMGDMFESTSVFPEETVRKWVLVRDYLRVSEDYIRSVIRLRQLIRYGESCFPVSSPRSHLVAEEYCGRLLLSSTSSPCTRSCQLHRVSILVNSFLHERVSGVPMRRGMRSPLTFLVDERRV